MKSGLRRLALLVAIALGILSGLAACHGTCSDILYDANNCGGCGRVCGPGAPVCHLGTCQACPAGSLVCTVPGTNVVRTCEDPNRSTEFCGASGACTGSTAGVRCPVNFDCVNAECVCSSPLALCAGECIIPAVDSRFCGASGDCTGPNAGTNCGFAAICGDGVCKPCPAGSIASCTGYCVDTSSDPAWCGASGDCRGTNRGTLCLQGQKCVNGVCM
jgi:hypothetical protein